MPAALNDLFAPAYSPTGPNTALEAWRARNANLTRPEVEATRIPVAYSTGNPAGQVDPAALQAMAQGGHYDMEARRNAIAAQVQANQAAAASAGPAPSAWDQYMLQNYGIKTNSGGGGGAIDTSLMQPQGFYQTGA